MPSPRVWIATFVTLVFTIGLLGGIVLERTVLHPSGPGSRVQGSGSRGPDGPGSRGPDGPGSRVQGPGSGSRGPGGPGGRGRGGPMFGPPPREYVEDLGRAVDLTDAQRTEITTMLQAQEARLQQMQEDARRVFMQEQAGLHDRIAAVMTPEQATAFRAWVTERTGLRGRGPR